MITVTIWQGLAPPCSLVDCLRPLHKREDGVSHCGPCGSGGDHHLEMTGAWEQLQVHLVMVAGHLHIVLDVRHGHAFILSADQVPLRHAQGQQRVG